MKPIEEEKKTFFKEADELIEDLNEFLMGKGVSSAVAIFSCMTSIAALATVKGIPKDMVVKLASEQMDRMKFSWDKMDKEAE